MKGYLGRSEPLRSLGTDVPTLVALLVCLIPTTIGALLAAIGIAGMDRALRANIIAKSGKAVELAGDVDTCCSTKPARSPSATATRPSSCRSGDTPPKSSAIWRRWLPWPIRRPKARASSSCIAAIGADRRSVRPPGAEFVPFSAQTRMSGVDLPDGRRIRKGAPDAISSMCKRTAARCPRACRNRSTPSPAEGATPLLVCRGQSHHRHGRAGRHPEARHPRALRAAAADGPAHRDGHRRQPADGQDDRRSRPASTISSPRPRPKRNWPTSARNSRAASSWP